MDKTVFLKELEEKISILHKMLITTAKNPNPKGYATFCSCVYHTSVKFTNEEEVDTYNSIINLILSYKNFDELFSEFYIAEQIIQLLHRTSINAEDIRNAIQEFYDSLIKVTDTAWYIISKMDDIEVLDSELFELVDCTIKILESTDLPYENYVGYDDFIGKPCILTNVTAGDSEKARNIALGRFDVAFNLLRLYTYDFKNTIKGILVTGNQDLIIWDSYNKSSIGTIKPSLNDLCDSEGNRIVFKSVHLNNKLYVEMKQQGIHHLMTANSISYVVKQCLYWFGLGLDVTMESAKLINFTTVLESALKKKDETTELKQRISDRCALLLGNDFETRIQIQKNINDIYKIRSKIVHQGNLIKDKDKDIVNLAGFYAQSVLINLIQNNSSFKGDFSKLINEIDERKYM